MNIDNTRQLQLDREGRGTRYYRNAVERHWDPHDIALGTDRDRLIEHLRAVDEPEAYFSAMRMGIARFGAGEQAVTEDLAPLSTARRYAISRSRSVSRSMSWGSQWRSTALR